MNMVETIKAGESETTEFKTSLAEGGCGSLPVPLTIPLCTLTYIPYLLSRVYLINLLILLIGLSLAAS